MPDPQSKNIHLSKRYKQVQHFHKQYNGYHQHNVYKYLIHQSNSQMGNQHIHFDQYYMSHNQLMYEASKLCQTYKNQDSNFSIKCQQLLSMSYNYLHKQCMILYFLLHSHKSQKGNSHNYQSQFKKWHTLFFCQQRNYTQYQDSFLELNDSHNYKLYNYLQFDFFFDNKIQSKKYKYDHAKNSPPHSCHNRKN